jgi:transposase
MIAMGIVLGIDISKLKFDVALLREGKFKSKVFSNDRGGFEALWHWLVQHGATKVHACMEATGGYEEALAEYLVSHEHVVSVVNPARIKAFGQSQLVRNKTDRGDARVIASFCQAQRPEPWRPLPESVKALRSLVQRVEALEQTRLQELNRLEGVHVSVRKDVCEHVAFLDKRLAELHVAIEKLLHDDDDLRHRRELLDSIPGIAQTTALKLLAHLGDVTRFVSARQLVAYAGLNPRQRCSGSSVRGHTAISKLGSAPLRRVLYMPALVLSTRATALSALPKRLRAAGRPAKVAIVAMMRKLLHVVFGVLKSAKPFDPTMHSA